MVAVPFRRTVVSARRLDPVRLSMVVTGSSRLPHYRDIYVASVRFPRQSPQCGTNRIQAEGNPELFPPHGSDLRNHGDCDWDLDSRPARKRAVPPFSRMPK